MTPMHCREFHGLRGKYAEKGNIFGEIKNVLHAAGISEKFKEPVFLIS